MNIRVVMNIRVDEYKFREGRIAFTSDIEDMCSRVRLTAEYAIYHRFLRVDKITGDMNTYQMNRLTLQSGDCCSPSVAVYAI